MNKDKALVPFERIERMILFIRGQKVMLDSDLAELCGVETKVLNRAVKRSIERFPDDFMFQLSVEEWEILKCHFGASSCSAEQGDCNPKAQEDQSSSWGGRRTPPYAFTEQGVAMLSGVLNSPRAIAVNIGIMRAFVHLRQLLASHKDLARKLEELERKYDAQFKTVFQAIRELMKPPEKEQRRIGFRKSEN